MKSNYEEALELERLGLGEYTPRNMEKKRRDRWNPSAAATATATAVGIATTKPPVPVMGPVNRTYSKISESLDGKRRRRSTLGNVYNTAEMNDLHYGTNIIGLSGSQKQSLTDIHQRHESKCRQNELRYGVSAAAMYCAGTRSGL